MTEISDMDNGDKIARLRERLFIAPNDTGTMLELADALEASNNLPDAIDLCQRAMRTDPYRADIAVRLGHLWLALGDTARAKPWFERALSIDPDNGDAIAGLSSLDTGEALTPAYIRTLFDQYAPRFDADLTETLKYQAPALVADALAATGCREGDANILDLGCGTGLSGVALRPFARQLDGVDLSPGMVAKARERGIYRTLAVDEAVAFLNSANEAWDVIAAVDVLNYLGELVPIFKSAAGRLVPGGLLVGTLEERLEGGVGLTPKRRYAHGADHLETATEAANLTIVSLSRSSLRSEGGVPVPGLIFVLRRP